jgi:hypothetical protein
VTNLSANRGEWSELYAIGYLLKHGGGFAADEYAQLDESNFYKVLQIVDNPSGTSETIYKIHDDEVEIFRSGRSTVRIAKNEISPLLSTFFDDLLFQSTSSAFFLTTGRDFMKLIHKNKLSASSALTSDLHLILEDEETNMATPRKGFSIKSEIGSPATVFNASHSTNLTYRLIGNGEMPSFENSSAVKTNVKSLTDAGFELRFDRFDSSTFEKSLKNIDSNLPIYLSQLLLAYTQSTTTSMKSVCEIAFPAKDSESELKVQKIKRFLSAASMGLKAGTIWSGYPEDFGGMLLVKRTGDVLFYYLYNMKKFEMYLYNHLRFETPSASRHGFGQIYGEKGDYFIKLNLQIRYK